MRANARQIAGWPILQEANVIGDYCVLSQRSSAVVASRWQGNVGVGERNADWRRKKVRRKSLSRCTVCAHREHLQIDLALARHVSVKALSRRFGISTDSLYRHSNAHLPPQVRARLIAGPDLAGVDLERLRQSESESLLAHLVALRNRLFAALDFAEEHGDSGQVARISGQLHENFGLVGKLCGDLATGSISITNILVQPEYLAMRMELVRALHPYPDARQAVAGVLRRVEEKAAQTIEGTAR